jgi:hypothetical protein
LTFKALSRNHVTYSPKLGPRNAMFRLNSWIPYVSISSGLARTLRVDLLSNGREAALPKTVSKPPVAAHGLQRLPLQLGRPKPSLSSRLRPCPLLSSGPRSAGHQSQTLSRSYGSILPTSLNHITPVDQRFLTLGPCCGYSVQFEIRFSVTLMLDWLFKGQNRDS